MSTPRCTTCGGHQTGTCCTCGYTVEAKRHGETRAQLAAYDAIAASMRGTLEALMYFTEGLLEQAGIDGGMVSKLVVRARAALLPDAGVHLQKRLQLAEDALTTWSTSGDHDRFLRKVEAWREFVKPW